MIKLFLPAAIVLSLSGSLAAENYELYILAGQSNMDGRGDSKNLPEELKKEFEKAIIFYRNPIGASDGWKKLRPGYSFAPKTLPQLPTNTFGPELALLAPC